jgi:hypothetical protein
MPRTAFATAAVLFLAIAGCGGDGGGAAAGGRCLTEADGHASR